MFLYLDEAMVYFLKDKELQIISHKHNKTWVDFFFYCPVRLDSVFPWCFLDIYDPKMIQDAPLTHKTTHS